VKENAFSVIDCYCNCGSMGFAKIEWSSSKRKIQIEVYEGLLKMKSEKFVADASYGEWQGEYEVRMLSAAERIEIEEKIFQYMRKHGLDPRKEKDYPTVYDRGLSLIKSVTKDGKPLPIREPFKLLKEIPNRLYTVLLALYYKLNAPSVEEQRFLQNL